MGRGQMTGSPWHVEVLRMDENDDRRHRSRCVHYAKESKYCDQYIGNCRGSAHCPYYEEGYIAKCTPNSSHRSSPKKKAKHTTSQKSSHSVKNTVKTKNAKNTKATVQLSRKKTSTKMSFTQALKNINK